MKRPGYALRGHQGYSGSYSYCPQDTLKLHNLEDSLEYSSRLWDDCLWHDDTTAYIMEFWNTFGILRRPQILEWAYQIYIPSGLFVAAVKLQSLFGTCHICPILEKSDTEGNPGKNF